MRHFLSSQIYYKYTVLLFSKTEDTKKNSHKKFILTSWYFLVTLIGTHWHSLQFWRQQAQFPPQRLTSRQAGQNMLSVLLSSSLMDTEKLRGVQLYKLTSSFKRFRSTTMWHKNIKKKIWTKKYFIKFFSQRNITVLLTCTDILIFSRF